MMPITKIKISRIYIWNLLTAIFVVLAMAIQPLSPFVDALPRWDSQIFITCSELMSKGLVMYRDLFDHKGPFIYIYDIMGLNIWGIHGIWLMALLFHGVSVYFYYKIAYVATHSDGFSRITSLFVFLMQAWAGMDNTVELVCMPFLTYSVYVMMACIWDGRVLRRRDVLAMSACFAVVFFVKPNFAACMVPPALYVIWSICRQRDWKRFWVYMLYLFLGFVLIAGPVVTYFNVHDALRDFVDTYFLFNFKYSSVVSADMRWKSFFDLFFLFYSSLFTWFFILLSSYFMIRESQVRKVVFLLVWLVFTAVLNLGLSGFAYSHYVVPVLPVGCFFIALYWNIRQKKIRLAGYSVVACYGLLYAFHACNVRKEYREDTYDRETYHVAEIIRKHTTPDDRIVLYSADSYLYVLSDRMPATRYIYQEPPFLMNPKMREDFFAEIYRSSPKILVFDQKHDGEFSPSFLNAYIKIDQTEGGLLIYKRTE